MEYDFWDIAIRRGDCVHGCPRGVSKKETQYGSLQFPAKVGCTKKVVRKKRRLSLDDIYIEGNVRPKTRFKGSRSPSLYP
jgi:hypothetical protein